MGFLSWLNPITAIGKVGNSIAKTLVGSKQERDQQDHTENMGVLNQFASEFHSRNNRTWWDSFWDGLNRMPRPVIVTSVLFYFHLAYWNPTEFQVLNIALSTVPENMWYTLGGIIAFYFAVRHREKMKAPMALTKEAFETVQNRIAELRNTKPMEEDDFQKEMANNNKPLSNQAILEWNRRRSSGQ